MSLRSERNINAHFIPKERKNKNLVLQKICEFEQELNSTTENNEITRNKEYVFSFINRVKQLMEM